MTVEEDDRYSTDAVVAMPWLAALPEAGEEVLHLVVACFIDEPDRVGQAVRLDQPGFIGRPHEQYPDEPPLAFVEQRPGESLATPDLTTRSVSRRQLKITPLGSDRVRVENLGKRRLFQNGEVVTECIVQAGDTLMLEHAVFLVERRPLVLPASAHYRGVPFPFGAPDPHGMVGESRAAWELRDQLAGAAASDGHVLLLGETGAGKEVAAGVVHQLSSRALGPYVERNAATMPETLVDSELFGTAKNYPNTGAPERDGLIGAAHGGYLMLDEIGELPEGHQAHLLRVLDNRGQYHRLGETRPRLSDFRLIAATNREPSSLKHDFLARFDKRVTVPGLDQRPSDIPFLVRELLVRMYRRTPDFVSRFLEQGDPTRARLEPRLVDALLRHRYQHHTRELQRLLQIAITSSRGDYLGLTAQLQEELAGAKPSGERERSLEQSGELPAAEAPSADEVVRALDEAGGSMNEAAHRLGISRHALRRLIKAHDLVKRFSGR